MENEHENLPSVSPKIKAREEHVFLEGNKDVDEVYQTKISELILREKSEILGFRKKWSNNLLWLVVSIVVFNAMFLLAIGRNLLAYSDEWLVRIIFAGSFIEVLGLARIVVQFLFKEPPKNLDQSS
jgi:organic radical activating enzyme